MKSTLLAFFLFITFLVYCQEEISFIVVSDLHFSKSDMNYKANDSIVRCMNNLPDENSPEAVSMNCKGIKGVIITGDATNDSLSTSFERFRLMYGLNGENELNYPVYEGFGNHDGNIDGFVRQQIKERNLSRKNLQTVSANGLHYSWNWGDVHLIHLNLYPGDEWDHTCDWCKYFKTTSRDAEQSLSFLKEDLQSVSSKTSTPIVIFMHYGWDDFSKLWWTESEQNAFYEVIKDYHVIGIFHGHDHGSKMYKWKGISIFDAGASVDGNGNTGSFMVVNIKDNRLKCKVRNVKGWINDN